MTTITTGYYAGPRLPGAGLVVISLVVPVKRHPETASWPKASCLMPRWRYFRAEPDDFEAEYLAQLSRYTAERITGWLDEIAAECGTDVLTLHCFERSGLASACHRGLFADWYRRETGIVVEEVTAQPTLPCLEDQP